MSKKNVGQIIAFILFLTLAVAGIILYFHKIKSVNVKKTLDQDFNDFQDEFDMTDNFTSAMNHNDTSSEERSYVSIPFETAEADEAE